MPRFFAFGCSYTNYKHFPTWAEWLGDHYDQAEIWAMGGGGNRFIANRVAEAVYRKSIGPEDTVVVQWSSPMREDRWFATPNSRRGSAGWHGFGNIYKQDFYSKDWVKRYFSEGMAMLETANYVHLVQQSLENTGCTWRMTWMELPTRSVDGQDLILLADVEHLRPYYNKLLAHPNMLQDIDSFKESLEQTHGISPPVRNTKLKPTEVFVDFHPNPLSAYLFVKNVLAPSLKINYDPVDLNLKWANEWNNYVVQWPRPPTPPTQRTQSIVSYGDILSTNNY